MKKKDKIFDLPQNINEFVILAAGIDRGLKEGLVYGVVFGAVGGAMLLYGIQSSIRDFRETQKDN